MVHCSPFPRLSFALRQWAGAWLLLLALLPGAAMASPAPAAAPGPDMEVFVREGCPHCAEAKVFLEALQRERPQARIAIRDLQQDPQAVARFRELLARYPGMTPGVPAFHVGGEFLIGFSGPETTGARLRGLLDGAAARTPQADAAAADCKIDTPEPCATPVGSQLGYVEVPWLGRIDIEALGLPLFTIAIGLLDGFNPCSMWVLILMMSMLAAVGDRRRMLAIAGTFVAVQGIAYYAFLAAWLNVFLLIGISRASEIVLGLIALAAGLVHVKDFFAFGRGLMLSIPAAAKPGIYQRMRALIHERSLAVAIAGTVVLGLLVQVVELLCTSGLPALYTRILTLRNLDAWNYYGYIGLYIVMYMIDDVFILGVGVVTLSQKRLQEKEGRFLKLLSGAIMVLLGVYLIFVPH